MCCLASSSTSFPFIICLLLSCLSCSHCYTEDTLARGIGQVGAGKAPPLDSFALNTEMEARLRGLISTKADKEAVEDMFNSCRKAIDARPSRAEMQVRGGAHWLCSSDCLELQRA